MQVLRQDVYFAMYIAHCMQMTTRLAHSCLVVALINPICVKHMTIAQLYHTQQWSFRRTGTMGTPSGKWCLGPSIGRGCWGWVREGIPGVLPPEKNFEISVASSCIFGRKMVRSAVHNAF